MPLRKLLVLLIVFAATSFFSNHAFSFANIPRTSFSDSNLYKLLHLPVKDFQKITHHKLTLKEKFFKII